MTKVFAKKLYEDYRAKTCGIAEAYCRFDEFNTKANVPQTELPELSNVEMQLCYDEYREDSEIKQAWETSGAEANVAMQSMMASHFGGGGGGSKSSSAPEEKKGKKTKPSEVIEMQ